MLTYHQENDRIATLGTSLYLVLLWEDRMNVITVSTDDISVSTDEIQLKYAILLGTSKSHLA